MHRIVLVYPFATFALAAPLSGCRSSATVDAKTIRTGTGAASGSDEAADAPAVTTPPESAVVIQSQAAPVPVDGGLSGARSFVQTRAPIRLALSADLGAAGDAFTLFDDSTKAPLLENQALDDAIAAANGWSVTLFPFAAAYRDKLTYGENQLRVLVDGAGGEHQAAWSVTRRDFWIVSSVGGAFASGLQREGGFEAQVGGAFETQVSNGETVLTIGKLSMLSR